MNQLALAKLLWDKKHCMYYIFQDLNWLEPLVSYSPDPRMQHQASQFEVPSQQFTNIALLFSLKQVIAQQFILPTYLVDLCEDSINCPYEVGRFRPRHGRLSRSSQTLYLVNQDAHQGAVVFNQFVDLVKHFHHKLPTLAKILSSVFDDKITKICILSRPTVKTIPK